MEQTELLDDADPSPEDPVHQEAQKYGGLKVRPEEEQITVSLDQLSSDPGAGIQNDISPAVIRSCFFPCNREDALLLLGSLCISEYFPDASVRLAIQQDGIALLQDGLRFEEIDLLNAGKVQRFPILIEVLTDVANRRPRVIGYGDILGLIFQSQSEADDFRFRPVDEFDTEAFLVHVDESKFQFEGEPRFEIRRELGEAQRTIGRNTDRLAAGVLRLLSLGNSARVCRPAVARFLCRPVGSALGAEEIDFSAAVDVLTGASYVSSGTRHHHAVVSAFAFMEIGSSGSLVDEVIMKLAVLPYFDSGSAKVERKWAEIARDVVKNRIALTGDLISDDRSVLLRAALLALVADRPNAHSAFLNAEKPSGPRVTTTSEFLVGLKYGLLNLSWSEKKFYAKEISAVAGSLIFELASLVGNAGQIFSVENREEETASTLSISLSRIALAQWTEKKDVLPDPVTKWWLGEFDKFAYPVKGAGRSVHSWVVQFSATRLIEVIHCVSGEFQFPMMRYFFGQGEKLRTAKDLKSNFSTGAKFWYPGTDEFGQPYLSCDVALLPDKSTREFLLIKLEDAIRESLVAKKSVKKTKINHK